MLKWRHVAAIASVLAWAVPGLASAESLKVLSAGALKQVMLGVIPQFESGGTMVQLDTDTVGGLLKRVEAGEVDLLVASPAALETLKKAGRLRTAPLHSRGLVPGSVKDGAPPPDISSVEAFKQALLKAKAVAYVDPTAGGTSGLAFRK